MDITTTKQNLQYLIEDYKEFLYRYLVLFTRQNKYRVQGFVLLIFYNTSHIFILVHQF